MFNICLHVRSLISVMLFFQTLFTNWWLWSICQILRFSDLIDVGLLCICLPCSMLNLFCDFLSNMVCNCITLDHVLGRFEFSDHYSCWFNYHMYVHFRNSIYFGDFPANVVCESITVVVVFFMCQIFICLFICLFCLYVLPFPKLNQCWWAVLMSFFQMLFPNR